MYSGLRDSPYVSCSDHYILRAGMASFTPVQAGGSREGPGQSPGGSQAPASIARAAPGEVCCVLPHNRCSRPAAWPLYCVGCSALLRLSLIHVDVDVLHALVIDQLSCRCDACQKSDGPHY